MASAFPAPGIWGKPPIKVSRNPVALTCLQWDRDGALKEEDRQSLLGILASNDASSLTRSRSARLLDF